MSCNSTNGTLLLPDGRRLFADAGERFLMLLVDDKPLLEVARGGDVWRVPHDREPSQLDFALWALAALMVQSREVFFEQCRLC
ncbi:MULTISPECIES: hypothetical protein [Pseudomonas]|uniref:Uncharacterized protein n=1 Tax=Pseudomonas phytophila TaxID=2867264 RepID=A0ABY6FJY9_9PSED|nr:MULTISPECIES: hypothetical protein [Pseudomonas]MCD5987231.1 hypothetical protein [Pseudomonas quasicaspiana]MDU8361022.1 hypothetical protein [Pseudomonas syringae group sp. J309-1]UXZ97959.1 hypothetical protein K3169_08800 [Pseudomonas phytophila]